MMLPESIRCGWTPLGPFRRQGYLVALPAIKEATFQLSARLGIGNLHESDTEPEI